MTEYYYINSANQQVGPVSIEALKVAKITADTMVWRQGLKDWKHAIELPELLPIIDRTPNVETYPMDATYMTKPSNYLGLAIFSTICCQPILGIVAIIYAAKVNDNWRNGFYDDAVSNSGKARAWSIASIFVGIFLAFLLKDILYY